MLVPLNDAAGAAAPSAQGSKLLAWCGGVTPLPRPRGQAVRLARNSLLAKGWWPAHLAPLPLVLFFIICA